MSWEIISLRDIVTISKGKKHTPNENGKNRYINIENLHNASNSLFTNESGLFVEENDLIIAWDGANAGKVGVGFSGVIGSTLARMKINNKKSNPRFLYWFLEFQNELIKSQRTGATIPHVNGEALKDLQIPLPPLTTQIRIAEILDAADALKRKDRELLKKYDELAQAIFIDMFGDPMKNEKGWEIYAIEEVTSFIDYRGKTPERSETEEVPLITAKNVKFGFYDFSEKDFVTLDKYNEIMTRGFPKVGDILFTTEGATLGNVCRIPDLPKFAIGQRLISMSGDKVTSEYLHYILCSDFFQNQVYKYATGSAVKGIRSAVLKKLIIPVPKFEVQLKFTSAIQAIEMQIKNAAKATENSNNIFSTLIQRAYKGELVAE